MVLSLFLLITTTVTQVALRTGSRDCMRYSGSDDGVRERCFPAP